MKGLYVDYNRSVVGHICAMWLVYLSRAYAFNVKFMYTSVPGHIFDALNAYEVYILTQLSYKCT